MHWAGNSKWRGHRLHRRPGLIRNGSPWTICFLPINLFIIISPSYLPFCFIAMMSPSNIQHQSFPQGYPPAPVGYPTKDDPNGGTSQQRTVSRGDDFWKGCLAAICCCCFLDCCCF